MQNKPNGIKLKVVFGRSSDIRLKQGNLPGFDKKSIRCEKSLQTALFNVSIIQYKAKNIQIISFQ